jgi:hypothetical protein
MASTSFRSTDCGFGQSFDRTVILSLEESVLYRFHAGRRILGSNPGKVAGRHLWIRFSPLDRASIRWSASMSLLSTEMLVRHQALVLRLPHHLEQKLHSHVTIQQPVPAPGEQPRIPWLKGNAVEE